MSRPLRVHLVHQGFGDYVAALADGLAGLAEVGGDRREIDLAVTTVASGENALSQTRSIPGATHETVSLPRFRDPRSPFAAWSAARRLVARPCDVLHWQAGGNPWVDLAFSRVMGRRPTTVTVHDMRPHPGDESVLPGTFLAIDRLVRRADQVIVHAPHVQGQAVESGADPARVVVLAHGELGTRYLPPERLPLPPSTEPVVLFFGRAQGYKGLDLLAEAMPRVACEIDGAKLVVAGAGPSIDEVFPPGRSTEPWCELVRGRVPDDRVPEIFARAAVVALPYREASQSGVAALAAGLGRPVVASTVPGLTDIVEDGVTGLLVRPGSVPALADALIRVLGDPPLVAELGAGGYRAAVTGLSWSSIANELVRVYDGARDHWSDHGGRPERGGQQP